MKKFIVFLLLVISKYTFAQDDLLSGLEGTIDFHKEYVKNAFKSTRVVNGQSMELLGKGVLDTRILHRFGLVNSGIGNLYGLDQASMRIGFDYGISNRFMIGIGRSNVGKEYDGYIKFRPIWQSTGGIINSPISVILVTGMTVQTLPWANPNRINYFSSRLSFFNQIIIGRKFTESFSLQVSPTMVHINTVPLKTDSNNIYALGIGSRIKLSKRTAFVIDYHYIVNGLDMTKYKNPLSVGFDIETGGHVFQLHFSNSTGMNEKAFITNTTNDFMKGEIRFGFNLSRVFTAYKPKN